MRTSTQIDAHTRACTQMRTHTFTQEIIRYYSLPLRLSSMRGRGGGPLLEVLPEPFVHTAYAQQAHETKHSFAQRLFAQLTTMVCVGGVGSENKYDFLETLAWAC